MDALYVKSLTSPLSDLHTGTECCGSIIDFGNKTSPTGTFTRITSGPAFYVSKGQSKSLLS